MLVLTLMLPLLFFPLSLTQVSWQDQIHYLNEDSFSIQWIHSVEKEEWMEAYTQTDSSLMLEKTRFKTYGAGVPVTGPATLTEDGYIEMQVQRKMEEIRLVVSPLIQSTLTTPSGRTNLYELADPYEEVLIQPVRVPFYSYVLYLIKKGGIPHE